MAELEVLLVRTAQTALALTAAGAVATIVWIEHCYRRDLPPRTDWSAE